MATSTSKTPFHTRVDVPANTRVALGMILNERLADFLDLDVGLADRVAHGRALAALSLSPLATDDERRTARSVARALAGTVLADDLSNMRVLAIEEPDDFDDDEDWNTLVIRIHESSVFAIHGSDNSLANSSNSYGFYYTGNYKFSDTTKLDWVGSYAEQSDYGDNPTDYTADYYMLQAGLGIRNYGLKIGYEVDERLVRGLVFRTDRAQQHVTSVA